jgi:L-2,4-diaminobutyrate decarboxylase
MKADVDVRSNRVVVRCTGRLDATGCPELESAVSPLLAPQGVTPEAPIILDMDGVDYLSSAGIRGLLKLVQTSRAALPEGYEGTSPLRIGSASRHVEDTLRMCCLWEELTRWSEVATSPGPPSEPVERFDTLMTRVREAFPAPVSDAPKDGYFVHTITNALDRLDELKTERPYLGTYQPLDYERARQATFPERMGAIRTTVTNLCHYLEGMTIWGHPRSQVGVVPPPAIPGIMGQLFASIYNPNIVWDELGAGMVQAEVEVISMASALVGYDPKRSGGAFTFGGTGAVFYGVRIGIEKAQPGAFREGIKKSMKVVASDVAHYAKLSALAWLGLGLDNLVTVPSDHDNSMGLDELETALRELLDAGTPIACILATLGTTDAFGVDNLEYIARLRDTLVEEYHLPYRPHIHADAAIGWPWAVFNGYDFVGNPMGFPARTLRSLWDAHLGMRAMALADSLGVDFHKTGFAPLVSSLFLCRDQGDLRLVSRDQDWEHALFPHGNYHPGVFTMETSRPGGAVLSALANLKFFGREGYRALLGHIVTVAEALRERLEKSPHACLVNDYNYGPVTLFRVYPDGVDARAAYLAEKHDPAAAEQLARHNEFNRQVARVLRRQMEEGTGVSLSFIDSYRRSVSGVPIVAHKSFVVSAFASEATMDHLMTCIAQARAEVMSAGQSGAAERRSSGHGSTTAAELV